MTDDVEHRLTVELRERVPEPPYVCSAQDVWDHPSATLSRRRSSLTRIGAVVAAVGVVGVVGVVASIVSLRGGTQVAPAGQHPITSTSSSPSKPSPRTKPRIVTDPRALVGPIWILQTYRPEHGHVVTAQPETAPTIKFAANGDIVDNSCSLATSTLSAGRIVFHQDFINGAVSQSCGPDSPIALSHDVQAVIGTGTVTWSITADTLTIRQAGQGVLVFRAERATATITGRLLLIGGPAPTRAMPGRPRPVAGSIFLHKTVSSYPVHANTDARGRFSVPVAPGRWTVTGHSAESNPITCVANALATAHEGRATHVNVFCRIP